MVANEAEALRSGGPLPFEVFMQQADADRALACRRRDALDRVAAHVPDREHSWHGRFIGKALQRSNVWPREDVAPLVATDLRRKPVGEGFGTDQHEERGGSNRLRRVRLAVP